MPDYRAPDAALEEKFTFFRNVMENNVFESELENVQASMYRLMNYSLGSGVRMLGSNS